MSTRATIAACAGLAAAALAGCGAGSSSSGPTSSTSAPTTSTAAAASAVSAEPPASGCGSFAAPAVSDDSGVIATLPPEYANAYAGVKVLPSKWSDWKPDHAGPYDVQIVWGGLVNPFITDLQNQIKDGLEKSDAVGSVEVTNTGNNLDIPQQIQQMQAALRKNPDLIVLLPLQPEAFKTVIDQAGAQGVPVVTVLGGVDSPYAVNVDINNFLNAARTTSIIGRELDGKGSLLTVEGYPSTTVNADALKGVDAVLKNCPQLKKVGSVVGAFVNATAKASVTQFLATHPQPVEAAVQIGGMGPGVLEAFQGVGRPDPALADVGASKGTLSYWLAHQGTFKAAGTGQSAPSTGGTTADVALRVLDGQGPRVNTLVGPISLITDENLKDWAEPGWTLATPGVADGPPENTFMSDEYLSRLFSAGS